MLAVELPPSPPPDFSPQVYLIVLSCLGLFGSVEEGISSLPCSWKHGLCVGFFFNNVLEDFQIMLGLVEPALTGAGAAIQHVSYWSKCQDSLYLFHKTVYYFADWQNINLFNLAI